MIVYDGLTNLTWFMGLIEDVNDPINAGRVKVRAFGFHPTIEEDTVDTDDLPWAPVLAASPHMHTPHDRGELVFGAFLDGRDAQQPLVFGIIPTSKFGVPVTSSSSSGGAGDTGQVGSSALATFPANGVGPLSQTDVSNLQSAMLQRESSGDYSSINQLGYVGGYQFGAAALTDLGYVKPGTSNGMLSDPNVWTGQNGMGSLDSFLGTPSVQDKAFVDLTQINYSRLSNSGKITGTTPPKDVAGYLSAAHLLGAGGVNSGLSNADANGTTGYEYFNLGSTAVGTGSGSPTTVPPTNPWLKLSAEVIEKFSHLALPPQATGEHQHKTPDGGAILDGKSYSDKGYSLNHPGVPSGGSYKTGVWNARYDGSYIEMHAGPNRDSEHVKVMHRSGSHIILDQNGNVTINSVGRVHINSSNDLEEVVEGFTTNVSKGGYAILVDGGVLSLHSTGDMNITSGSNINMQAAGNIMMNSGGSLDVSASRIGISSKVGDLSMLAAEKIEIQSVGITSVNGDSVIVTGKNSIQQKTDAYLLNSSTIGLKSTGDANISTGDLVLNSSTLGLKSSGYTTIQAGGFANILGSQIHMNDGGSVGSATVADVADLEDTTGAINLPTPPAHEMGRSSDVKPDPTPGNIGSDHIDDTTAV